MRCLEHLSNAVRNPMVYQCNSVCQPCEIAKMVGIAKENAIAVNFYEYPEKPDGVA